MSPCPEGRGAKACAPLGRRAWVGQWSKEGDSCPSKSYRWQPCSPDVGPWELYPTPTCVGPFQMPMAYVLGLSTTCHCQQLGWSLRALPHQICFLSAETIHPCTGEEPTFGEPTGPGLLGKAGGERRVLGGLSGGLPVAAVGRAAPGPSCGCGASAWPRPQKSCCVPANADCLGRICSFPGTGFQRIPLEEHARERGLPSLR